jgi:hypothetical protein
MRIKTIERIKFALSGRAVPVIRVADIDEKGKVVTFHFMGNLKRRENSLVATWDDKGFEMTRPGEGLVNLIDEKGLPGPAYIVSELGKTIDLFVQPWEGISWSGVIGRKAGADDIADNMDLGKSMRNLLIGILLGAGIGTFILGPLIQSMMK